MKRIHITVFLVFCLLVCNISLTAQVEDKADTTAETGSITVEALGFKNNEGKARLLLFTSEEGKHFPADQDKAFVKRILPIENNKVVFELQDIPYGDYAISVHHDENNDDKVNSNWIGIPKESLGASNDAKGSFGPPPFEKAKIAVDTEQMSITINMVN